MRSTKGKEPTGFKRDH